MWALDIEIEREIYDSEREKAQRFKNVLSSSQDDWIDCMESDLKIGDVIYVEYLPDSQKYMYTHSPEYGTVREINTDEYYSPIEDKQKSFLCITIKNQNDQLVKINKDHLSIYSTGYYMCIKKYKPKND
jgi:hypothetical protein